MTHFFMGAKRIFLYIEKCVVAIKNMHACWMTKFTECVSTSISPWLLRSTGDVRSERLKSL